MSLLAVVGLASAFGVWDRSTGVWLLDLFVWGGVGGAFVALVDGAVTLLRSMIVVVLSASGRPTAAQRIRRTKTSSLSFPLAALWFALGWRFVPEGSMFGFARAGAVGSMIVLSMMAAGFLWGALAGDLRPWRRVVIPLLVPLATVGWMWWPGPGSARQVLDMSTVVAPTDPGAPGSWTVLTTTYGSGRDHRRTTYGTDVGLTTATVDGSSLWPGPAGPIGAWWRWYWGFEASSMPLDALVWYPDGDGPFPLVLIVHGNHSATHSSEPGYAYLAEHLASRGFVVASVDENFMNGSALYEPAGTEMAARAWLLTEHLAQWQRWNDDPRSPFFGAVDMGRVVLIGHSRGGEAVAHAAAMVDRACAPATGHMDPALEEVAIAGVVAIAPSDGQYLPCGRPAELEDVDYLTISGSSDADTEEFFGLAQYERTTLDDDDFAAAVYVQGATHGRFNTAWGLADLGGFDAPLLDRASFLSEEEQQAATRTLVGGFVEASAHDRLEYLGLFEEPDAGGWLASVITTRFRTARTVPVRPVDGDPTGFEDVDSEVVELPDGYPTGEWVRRLRWSAGAGSAELAHRFAPRPMPAAVWMDLAWMSDARESAVTLTLTSADGSVGRAPLTASTSLRGPVRRHFVKSTALSRLVGLDIDLSETAEPMLQTYIVPLDAFDWTETPPAAAQVNGLALSIRRSGSGQALLGDVRLPG